MTYYVNLSLARFPVYANTKWKRVRSPLAVKETTVSWKWQLQAVNKLRSFEHLELYLVNNDENCLEASYELRCT